MIIRAVTITATLAVILFLALFFVFQNFFVDGRVVLPWDPEFTEVQPDPSPDDDYYSESDLIDEYEESTEYEESEYDESTEHEENEDGYDNS